jgi:hypothetical protein
MNTSMSRWHAHRASRGRRAAVTLAAFAVLAGSQVVASPTASAETFTSYEGPAFTAAGSAPTEDKPQSKLWYADNAWWALMRTTPAGVTVHQLQANHTWKDTGIVVDDRPSSTGDALWENGKLYVASRSTNGSVEVARLSLDAAAGRFKMDAGFPVTIGSGAVESVTITRDSQQRLWVTFTAPDPADATLDRVMVAHSTGNDTTWGAPFEVPVADRTVDQDDISAIVSFGGKIGVMWSDQQNQVVRFAVHPDTSADGADWTMETALSGVRSADDHVNLKSLLEDPSGRIYAAIKTSRGDDPEDAATDPDIQVLTRAGDGNWTSTTVAKVRDRVTRPQLAIDATNRELYVIMSTLSGGEVYYKKSPLTATPSFEQGGPGTTLITKAGALIDNATTAKAPVTAQTGLVVLASDDKTADRRYYHAEMTLDGAVVRDTVAPSTPGQVTATAGGSGVTVRWAAATDNTAVTSYRVMRSGTAVAGAVTGTSFVDSSVQAGQTYAYTVSAVDAAGNRSPESTAVSVTIPATPATPPPASGTGTFSDVPPGAPFAGDIEWLAAEGIAKGNADGTFRPNSPVIRQAMAVFLFHFANRTAPVPACPSSPYPDVPRSSLYCGSISWLADAGITRGTANGTFQPLGTVTRQQMAVFIYHLEHDGASPPPCTTAAFRDVPKSSIYCGAIQWMADQGLTRSTANYGPTAAVTRGMMAAFLHRFDGR